jgi:hypothetical protein
MPTAVCLDDNADGEPEDEDDALAVPGFASSALSRFRARAVGGGTRPTQWVARTAESVPGWTTIPCLASVAAVVRHPGWAVAEVGSGGGERGSGLMANAGGRQNGPLMSWAAAMDGQGLRGGRQADDRAYRQGGGDGADRGDIGSGGGGCDGGGHSAGFGEVEWPKRSPRGADAIE